MYTKTKRCVSLIWICGRWTDWWLRQPSNNTSFLFSSFFLMGELKKRSLLRAVPHQAKQQFRRNCGLFGLALVGLGCWIVVGYGRPAGNAPQQRRQHNTKPTNERLSWLVEWRMNETNWRRAKGAANSTSILNFFNYWRNGIDCWFAERGADSSLQSISSFN